MPRYGTDDTKEARDDLEKKALETIKRVIKGKGKISGLFYIASHKTNGTTLVANRAVKDASGAKTLQAGKKLKTALTATMHARGKITYEEETLTFTAMNLKGNLKSLKMRLWKDTKESGTSEAKKLSRLLKIALFRAEEDVLDTVEAGAGETSDEDLQDSEVGVARALTSEDLKGLDLDEDDIQETIDLEEAMAGEIAKLDRVFHSAKHAAKLAQKRALELSIQKLENETFSGLSMEEEAKQKMLRSLKLELQNRLQGVTTELTDGTVDTEEDEVLERQMRKGVENARAKFTKVAEALKTAGHSLTQEQRELFRNQLALALSALPEVREGEPLGDIGSSIEDGYAVLLKIAKAQRKAVDDQFGTRTYGLESEFGDLGLSSSSEISDHAKVFTLNGVPYLFETQGKGSKLSGILEAVTPPATEGDPDMDAYIKGIDAVWEVCQANKSKKLTLPALIKLLEAHKDVDSVVTVPSEVKKLGGDFLFSIRQNPKKNPQINATHSLASVQAVFKKGGFTAKASQAKETSKLLKSAAEDADAIFDAINGASDTELGDMPDLKGFLTILVNNIMGLMTMGKGKPLPPPNQGWFTQTLHLKDGTTATKDYHWSKDCFPLLCKTPLGLLAADLPEEQRALLTTHADVIKGEIEKIMKRQDKTLTIDSTYDISTNRHNPIQSIGDYFDRVTTPKPKDLSPTIWKQDQYTIMHKVLKDSAVSPIVYKEGGQQDGKLRPGFEYRMLDQSPTIRQHYDHMVDAMVKLQQEEIAEKIKDLSGSE